MAHILIIEDDHHNREMAELILRAAGHTVSSTGDAISGMRMAAYTQPDLILMDLALPRLDGWAATWRLKAYPPTRRIPVLHSPPTQHRTQLRVHVPPAALRSSPSRSSSTSSSTRSRMSSGSMHPGIDTGDHSVRGECEATRQVACSKAFTAPGARLSCYAVALPRTKSAIASARVSLPGTCRLVPLAPAAWSIAGFPTPTKCNRC